MGVPQFNTLPAGDPCEYPDNFISPENRRIVLPDAENRMIITSFVWTEHQNVTEGQIDRETGRQTSSS